METIKKCKSCNVVLVPTENWSAGVMRARSYICRTCLSERGKQHYKMHAERAAELQRIRLSQPETAKAAAELKSRYYAQNKDRWIDYRKTQKRKESTIAWHRAGRLVTWIRARAARKGWEFDLTRDWVETKLLAGRCEVSGIALELDKPDGYTLYPWAPSVDRIDSRKGYTQENCRIVVWAYNVAKAEWADSDVLKLAKALLESNK